MRHHGVGGGTWRRIRNQVLNEETNCWLCGRILDLNLPRNHPNAPQVDHVIPLAAGGPMYDRENLRACCRACNRNKSDQNAADTPVIPPLETTRNWS